MQRYEEVWEKEGRWLLGPSLLADVVEFLKDKGLRAAVDEDEPSRLLLSVPLPTCLNEPSGERYSVYYAIPEELRGIFSSRCDLILSTRSNLLEEVEREFLFKRVDAFTLAQIGARCDQMEREKQVRNDPDDPPLWVIAAREFGLNPCALPTPARMAT